MPEDVVIQGGEGNTPSPADLIKNTKAEMDRKLGNVESTIAQLAETNKALAAQLANLNKPPAPAPNTKSYGQKFYENEDATLNEIEQNATKRAVEIVSKLTQTESQRQSIIGQMVNEYPELVDPSTDLRKKAVEIFNTLSEDERSDPRSYKIAVRDAAAELGMLPKSKRKADPVENDDDDSFTLNNASPSPSKRARDKNKNDKLSEETLLFAELLGRPIDDEKYVERLKKANQRGNWNKYRKV